MKISLCKLVVLVLVSFHSNAQQENYRTITGTVINDETEEPLGNASIGIANRGVGTISNDLGQFILRVPEQFINDTLVVSYLGYAQYSAIVSTIGSSSIEVKLISVPIVLNEVSIQTTKLNADEIIEKAVEAIKDNYPTDAFIIEGFFRDIEKQDENYVELTEAAIKVFDKNFQRRLNNGITEDVIILQARKSINYADAIIRSVRKQNVIMDLLDNNPVHYPRGILNTKYFNYQIDSVFNAHDDVIYVISTVPGNHRIYVAESNYAIVKTIEEVKVSDVAKRPEFILNDSLVVSRMAYFQAVSEFQKNNGKMYLKYSNETDAYEILHRKSRKTKILVESYKEFVVTNIIDKDVQPFPKKEIYRFDEGVVTKEYNPEFWKEFSTIQLSPLNPQVKKNLERSLPLKDQFAGVQKVVVDPIIGK